MKRIVIAALSLLVLSSCKSDDSNLGVTQSIVDKIFDYNDNLLAEYFYNENNQLIKRTTTINEGSSELKFQYTNNRITLVEYTDFTFPQFNHTILIFYNQQGKIIKDEKHHYGNIIEVNDYAYYANGNLKECRRILEGLNTVYSYIYNNTNNVEEVIALLPEFTEGGVTTGNYIETSYNYEYDNGYKPDFRIGQIFQIELLPGFGTIATFEKNLSLNNMTKSITGAIRWIYTYNENDLPETIEAVWNGIETEEPILWRIQYKEIE